MSKNFSVICMANYCRSPVALHLLKQKYPNYRFTSAGISPLLLPNMDRRSESFLKKKGMNELTHLPKKISKKIISDSEINFAMDPIILLELNKLFPAYKEKIKLINYLTPSEIIHDPYKYNAKDYETNMLKIESVISKLNLE